MIVTSRFQLIALARYTVSFELIPLSSDQDPEPPASWDGVRQASYEKNMSAQMCEYTKVNVTGTEDCLYLNIYVPHECQSDISYKAVMVWIHDGDFHHGSGDYSEARPDYFMKKDVILVTVNYRLSILGKAVRLQGDVTRVYETAGGGGALLRYPENPYLVRQD